MEPQGGITNNPNGSKNLNLGLVGHNRSANAFVDGYKDKQGGSKFGSAGANVTLGSPAANVGITGTHILKSANQVSASTNLNLINANNHKVDVNAHTTKTFPKGPGLNYSTHGGGVNYSYSDKVTAGVAMSNTPMFKHREQSITAGVNLIQTPSTSLSLNAGVNRQQSPFHNSGWQPNGSMMFRKQF